jgi:predicted amidohydrolase
MYIVMGMAEKERRRIYNSAVLVGPEGMLGVHRKVHMAPSPVFTEGCNFSVCKTEIGMVGTVICADMKYPESVRSLALQGAQIVVNSTAWGMDTKPNADPRNDPSGYAYDLITRTTALMNKVWLVSADQVGAATKSREKCYGHSRIVDPQGRIIKDSGYKEEMVVAEVDVQAATGPDRFKGRRPRAYYPLGKWL